MIRRATARAHANIALVKYWGKRDVGLNLPAVGSISATLESLHSETTVEWHDGGTDSFELDGGIVSADAERVRLFLDLFRAVSGARGSARVVSKNNFPTAAGLASSASGFAALTVATAAAAGITLTPEQASVLARRGSGSAPRSLFGGFVEMRRGGAPDGSDSVAMPMHAPEHWPLQILIAITSVARKPSGSTDAMQLTAETSPYYAAWVRTADADLSLARQALAARDFAGLAAVAESSCLKMHATMMTAQPGILYWNDATMRLVRTVRELRADGLEAFFTIDAGPQVKIFCSASSADAVEERLAAVPGIARLLRSGLGPAAHLLSGDSP